jgi:cytosine deaminase
MHDHRHLITLDDTIERAERAARLMLANGVTAIRTHADTTTGNDLMSVHALIEVRERLRGLVDVQVCTLVGRPVTGADGAEHRALLRAAIDAGVDLVGGCPHLDPDPSAATDLFLEAAADAGLPIDLHTDETLNPDMLTLEHLAHQVLRSGFAHGVTASHCVSLGIQPAAVQQRVAEAAAEAGISIVALPHTNLFLQGREHQERMPRALTAVRALTAAGVNVASGADNLQDPFNPVGRADPLETAGLMIMAAHQLPDDALAGVSGRSRRALGLAGNDLVVGAVADLVALPATTVREAIAFGPPSRIVVSAGRVVVG